MAAEEEVKDNEQAEAEDEDVVEGGNGVAVGTDPSAPPA